MCIRKASLVLIFPLTKTSFAVWGLNLSVRWCMGELRGGYTERSGFVGGRKALSKLASIVGYPVRLAMEITS